MRAQLSCVLVMVLTAGSAMAQDTRYAPEGEQIPAPRCMQMTNAWEGPPDPCPVGIHAEWLKDITHWRMERRIRIAFDPKRYEMPELKWTQSEFHSAADDGAGSFLLRSGCA